jgi:transposase-like protein
MTLSMVRNCCDGDRLTHQPPIPSPGRRERAENADHEGENIMATAKELRIWANTMRQWITQVENIRLNEDLARVAAEMERLAAQKEPAERQLI